MRDAKELYDVVVVGGGPAGLTAALYLARARCRVVVVEQEQLGGQITITAEVVNYPGVEKNNGRQLSETMRRQAQFFGAEWIAAQVVDLDLRQDVKIVKTNQGELSCLGVLLATGAHPRMIGFSGEEEMKGRGVAYCATCDGEFFTGREIFVVGGGFAAAEESVFLTKFASHVTVLVREEDFTCARAVAERAKQHPNITVLTETEVEAVSGDTVLRGIRYRNNRTGEVTEYRPDDGGTFGVFVFAGYEPSSDLVKGIAELDQNGYVVTDRNQKTSVDGLYAAGDVCIKNLRQVVTAVSDGAIAATELERYVEKMRNKTGWYPEQKALSKPSTSQEGPDSVTVSTADSLKGFDDWLTVQEQEQLQKVFRQMKHSLRLQLCLDDRPISLKLREEMERMASLTDRLTVEVLPFDEKKNTPVVEICRQDGTSTGLSFHGVPGGHEFSSFVLGLYHAAGGGQKLDPSLHRKIQAINRPIRLQVLVSLSCTMCPDLVVAAQRIAAENPYVTADIYDINHFPALRERYHVMSVPCLVMNDDRVSFGRKKLEQLLEWLG